MAENTELEDGEILEETEIDFAATFMKNDSHMPPNFKGKRHYSSFSSWGKSRQPRIIQNKYNSGNERKIRNGKKNEKPRKKQNNVKEEANEKKGKFDDIFNHNGVDSGYELDDYELLLARHQLIQQQLKRIQDDNEPMIVLSEYEADEEKLLVDTEVTSSSIYPAPSGHLEQQNMFNVKNTLEDEISLGKDVVHLSDSSQNEDNDEELEMLRNILISQAKKKNDSLQKIGSVKLVTHNKEADSQSASSELPKIENSEKITKDNCLQDSSEKNTEALNQLVASSIHNKEFQKPCLEALGTYPTAKEKVSLKKFRQRRTENKIRKENRKSVSVKRLEKIQTRSQTAAAEKGLKERSSQMKLKIEGKRKKKKRGGKRSRLLAIRALHKDEFKKILKDLKEETTEDDYNSIPMEIDDDQPSAYVDGFAPLPLIETTEVPPPLPTAPPSPSIDNATFKPTVDIVPQYMTSSNVSWMPGYVESLYCDGESLGERSILKLKDKDFGNKVDIPDKLDEEEVWALRAQALKSLACKRAAKVKKLHKENLYESNQPIKPDTTFSLDQKVKLDIKAPSKVTAISNISNLNNADIFKKFMPPKHAPVVIQLSKEDFESDDDGEQNKSIQSCNAELDQLFQQARTESTQKVSSIKKSGDDLLLKNLKFCIEKSVTKMKKHSSSIVKDQLTYKKLQKDINEKRSTFTALNNSVKELQEKLQTTIQERNITKKIHNNLHVQFKVVKDRLKEKISVRKNLDEKILRAKSIISLKADDDTNAVTLNDKMRHDVESLMNSLTAYFISHGDLSSYVNTLTKGHTTKVSALTVPASTSSVMSENDFEKIKNPSAPNEKEFRKVSNLPPVMSKNDLKKLELRKKINNYLKKNVVGSLLQEGHKNLTLGELTNHVKNKTGNKISHRVVEQIISINFLPDIKSMADLKELQKKITLSNEQLFYKKASLDSLLEFFENRSFIAPSEVEIMTSTRLPANESVFKKYNDCSSDDKYRNFELFSKYSSVLNNFKSYRLSPYFRTQSRFSLQSATFSNHINPCQVMCKYEVFGTCNDKLCKCWHFKDKCSLDQIDLINDLVSYEPGMFEADKIDSIEKKRYLLSLFTKDFVAQYSGKMSSEEQLLLLWNQLKEFRRSKNQASHECISFNCRNWFIDQAGRNDITDIHIDHHYFKCFKPIYFLKRKSPDSRNIQSECQEVRYFSESYNNSEVLEEAIIKDPSSVKLWLSLAKLRLRQGKPDDAESKLSNKEHALSVLSHSLEENRDSEELWIEYLNLVAKNTTPDELRELCYQAVMYAGTYNVWWTCLNLECTYLGKQEICTEMINFVLDSNETKETQSHYLLEIVLYVTQLLINRGKIKLAVDYLASALGRTVFDNKVEKLCLEDLSNKLVVDDKALLWMCFISVKVFLELPKVLFMSEQSDSGRLVNKNKFVLDWTYNRLAIDNEEVRSLFSDAIKCLATNLILKSTMVVYENMVAFELSVNQKKNAIQILRDIVNEESGFVEGWVLLLSIYIEHSPMDAVVTIAEEALHKCDQDVEIVYFYTNWLYKENMPSLALEKLIKCVHVYFELPIDGTDFPDVLILYQKILGLPIPYSITLPTYIPKTSEHLIFYYWMCYCLVLKIKNVPPSLLVFPTAVDEAFECAVHQYTSRRNTKKLWLAYIKYKLCFLHSPDVSEVKFINLLYRCLASVAAGEVADHCVHWKDYSFHNKLLDLCLPYINIDAHAQFFQKTLELMPDNVYHALRVCEYEIHQKNYNQARFICGAILADFPKFLPLWRMAIQIELKCDNIQEARWLYGEATKSLPFVSLLWKEYLKFEITNAKDGDKLNDVLDEILSKCKENGISLEAKTEGASLNFFVT